MDAKKYTITAGSIKLFNAGDVYSAERLIWHPNYDPATIINDIALIRVAKNITFKNAVQPIPLASQYDISTNDSGVITGWGKLVVSHAANIPKQSTVFLRYEFIGGLTVL